jgi:hypothetical protein
MGNVRASLSGSEARYAMNIVNRLATRIDPTIMGASPNLLRSSSDAETERSHAESFTS